MSPLVQTKQQIYLPGGAGGVHGAAQELSITDKLGPARIIITETQGGLTDASSMSFSSPDMLGALLDLGTLIYTDLESEGALQDLCKLFATTSETNGAMGDSAQSLLLQLLETNGAFVEARTFTIWVAESNGGFVEAGQLVIVQQETQNVLTDQFSATINLQSIETNGLLQEAISAIVQVAEANGTFTELSQFTVSLIGNLHAATAGWTNPASAVDNSLTTFAQIVATASGIGNVTSNTTNANSDVDFPDFALPAGFAIASVFLDVYSKADRTAQSNAIGGTPGTASFTNNYSTDGTNYTALTSRSGSSNAVVNFWNDSVTPNIFDLTAVVNTQAKVNAFRFRTVAQVVSGATATGAAPQSTLNFYGVVLRLIITG